MSDIKLYKQEYKLFAYEKVLASREIQSVLQPTSVTIEGRDAVVAHGCNDSGNAKRLVFCRSFEQNGVKTDTDQYIREKTTQKKQNTRYYTHGIHEYKGKFNPQIVKVLLNIFNVHAGQRVLDPFCGSGTSLFETQLMGGTPFGVDINPMAVFIARTKTSIANEIENFQNFDVEAFVTLVEQQPVNLEEQSNRMDYLKKWFLEDYLRLIEQIRLAAEEHETGALKNLILLTASNILRDYSEQEPSDLRIRRRNSPYPQEPFLRRFVNEFHAIQEKILKMANDNVGNVPVATIHNDSIVNIGNYNEYSDFFDFAITSPPYATALPYIDTQRLSLVWLGFAEPSEIAPLECSLIGSRELKRKSTATKLHEDLLNNTNGISISSLQFCMNLQNMLEPTDGFRKQNVPILLYKYISEMRNMFEAVYKVLKPGAYYCLVVGHNKTTIGGKTLIDTPTLLCNEAGECGFTISEIVPLETYQRYGIHAQNAITNESLIVLQKPE